MHREIGAKETFNQLALPIFQLRPDGKGTTMTGNLLRTIFRDHTELFSESTGIPLPVIKNVWNLYLAGVSNLPIDPDKFSKLADETLKLYRAAIPWYPINVSFHRMQRHWPEIMRLLPPTISIGMLSEVQLFVCSILILNFQILTKVFLGAT